ncbi:MAG: ABC transporter ATP-binding protein [Planctomycetaceae bacterium]|nr:ABC transporter ATP-binding protein [Planctomycetaceae bacterium]
MSDLAIKAQGLTKSYRMGRSTLRVLRGVDVQVCKGEFAVVVGASGSGKSTLLHLIGLLDKPEGGSIWLDGIDAAKLPAAGRNLVRCRDVGFVFQFYHLVPELNIVENVLLPVKVDSPILSWPRRRRAARTRAAELLESLGLAQRLRHRPRELSGGERQRVAIARALINNPKVLLADEPTGNLDSVTGKQIISVLKDFNRQHGQTILMVTHDNNLAQQADSIFRLTDGRLSS